jgi:hypothetical protein
MGIAFPPESGQGVFLETGPDNDVNLSEVISKGNSFNAAHSDRNTSECVPFFDDALQMKDIWASDVEFSEICLPWFHSTNKHPITHECTAFLMKGSFDLWFPSQAFQSFGMMRC